MRNIKRFIKYRGYPYLRMYFKNKANVRLVFIPLTAGVSLLGSNLWVPLVLKYLPFSLDTNSKDSLTMEVVSKIVGIIMILFSLFWANRILIKREKKSTERTKAILKQWSLDSSEKNDISNNPKSAIYVYLDQRVKQGESRIDWIKRSLEKQREAIADFIYVVEGKTHPLAHYEGMASIPFVFLVGYQVGDSRDFQFLEWDEFVKKWVTLPQVVDHYQPLHILEDIKEPVTEATDVSICISLTNEIQKHHLKGIDAENYNLYHLKLDDCGRHAIKCAQQLAEYKKQFRILLDEINDTYPLLQRVHIFISAQTSLVFTLGSSLTRNDMKFEFWVYNYEPNSEIPYEWALKPHKSSSDSPSDEYIKINS
ncbi:hypothetical protein COM05_18835 [Bacillus toyonensis]|uniref:SAVED domain-containing protein n=1 Tax=Bacillus toyonensis TaxID=155322 RepID=UPI000BF62B24|nr:SAVED domain-containing protein [Bacillus toyonensis]PGB81749.1 hypothetical protein COM05_18835 [Bacillus toyonensis]